jgi:hypothetical protein
MVVETENNCNFKNLKAEFIVSAPLMIISMTQASKVVETIVVCGQDNISFLCWTFFQLFSASKQKKCFVLKTSPVSALPFFTIYFLLETFY